MNKDAFDFSRRYDRNYSAVSENEMKVLKNAKVCVVGCGGLGGYIIEYLGRLGIGRIKAVDGDVFDVSNLNRQLFSTETNIGEKKAAAAAERMALVNSDVEIESACEFLTEDNAFDIVRDCDAVADALDSLEARLVLEKAAEKAGIPLIHGAIAGWTGQVAVCMPGSRRISEIYGVSYGDENDVAEFNDCRHEDIGKNGAAADNDENTGGGSCGKGDENESGNLSFTAAVVAGIEASETVKTLLGKNTGETDRMIMIDLLEGEFETVEI